MKLRFVSEANSIPCRIKVEINCNEHFTEDRRPSDDPSRHNRTGQSPGYTLTAILGLHGWRPRAGRLPYVANDVKIRHNAIYQFEGKNAIIAWKISLGLLYPLNGSAAGRGTRKSEKIDRSCIYGGWLSTGKPGVRDVRGAKANPHSVRESAYDACWKIR